MALADHIAVIYDGQITGCVRVEEADAAGLGLMMAGERVLASPALEENGA